MNCISISYKKTPQEVREQFSFSPDQQRSFFHAVRTGVEGVTQCVILSTCNRCEIYFDGTGASLRPMEDLLCQVKGFPLRKMLPMIYVYTEDGAVLHLIRVASGIDSMVLGEDEILRQLKEAYQTALDAKMTAFEFNTVFQMAISAAKDIKTNTGLSTTPVSFGTLAANEVFHWPGRQKRVLIIGVTGKIGSITAKNLGSKPEIELWGTTRSLHGKNPSLSDLPMMHLVSFAERYRYMDDADIVISATTSPHYTVTQEELEPALVTAKPRLFIDLAVPADMDRCIAEIKGVRLLDIDWFRAEAEKNTAIKQKEAQAAGKSAEAFTDEIQKELQLHHLISKLPELEQDVSEQGIDNLIYSLRSLASRSQVEAVVKWLDDYMRERRS